MKFLFPSLVLSSSLRCALALIDCSEVNRATDENPTGRVAACDHFLGIENQSYLNWYTDSDIDVYPNSAFLQGSDPQKPQDGAAVHWRVGDGYVHLAIAARATGWVAFGLSEAGGMIGTDMVIFTAARPNELIDAYTGEERLPQTDDCESDWELVSSNVDLEGGFIMFETKRLLNTNDPQDKPIIDDSSTIISPHRAIAAWGDSEEMSYHGLNRARGAIRFHGQGDEESTFRTSMEVADGSVDLLARNFTIPTEETIYESFCFTRQELIDQGLIDTQDKLNIIGWEPLVQAGNEAYVHHYVVTASNQPSCNLTAEELQMAFIEMTYVWAPGEKGIAFPDFLGVPLFGDDGFQAFRVEIHYNNPTLDAGVVDNSGVRFYWTSEPREQEIGIMNVGDPFVGVRGQTIGSGLSFHQFECPRSCSALAGQEVTVLREYLHMHEVGLRITNEQIRDGEIVHKAAVEHWEFHQNGNAAVQQGSFVVQPGDSFRTTCFYDDQDGSRTFGLASAEEMCMAFLYYYPRQKFDLGDGFSMAWFCGYDMFFPQCNATYESRALDSKEELNREYAIANPQCKEPPTEEDSGRKAFIGALGLAAGALGVLMI
ncbi:copper type II ascorbate-dependent monooxygenase [Nitzschia inconspicua]|uniref:Copper type II ascorbate-dependent monooxygenase n=1 Tax=Nitzschia inconspicua TaxID=303405 RepID=A0A9K3PRC6_9STRA|nr:copper type II ascorbate-dependent monooxygenase [Nitzschia inconspicua]